MVNQNKVFALILAGGKGTRIAQETPKQFIKINNKYLIIWTLEKFIKNNLIDEIIITSPENYLEFLKKITCKLNQIKPIEIICGGKTRQESSYKALTCKNFKENEIVLIHDAARPFVTDKTISECITEAQKNGAAGTYTKTIDTIASIENKNVTNIIDRTLLYNTQTPQAFTYKTIKKAHDNALEKDITDATDDISLVLKEKIDIKMVNGNTDNFKITTPVDLKVAEILLKGQKK